MVKSKESMLYAAKQMKGIILSIEELLEEYDGIEGNKNYVKYCYNKAKSVSDDGIILKQLYDDTYNSDISKREGINISTLINIIENYFKILDQIDTASDIFKPKWCKISRTVNNLQSLRWLYCTTKSTIGENNDMVINGECFKKEERIILTFDN